MLARRLFCLLTLQQFFSFTSTSPCLLPCGCVSSCKRRTKFISRSRMCFDMAPTTSQQVSRTKVKQNSCLPTLAGRRGPSRSREIVVDSDDEEPPLKRTFVADSDDSGSEICPSSPPRARSSDVRQASLVVDPGVHPSESKGASRIGSDSTRPAKVSKS